MKKITLLVLLALLIINTSWSQEVCDSVTNDTPTPTLDNDVEVTDTVEITDDLSLTNLTLDITVTHTFIGDVKFDLISPAGTALVVERTGRCGSSMNGMDATYTDEGQTSIECVDMPGEPAVQGLIKPFSSFSNLNGESTLGTWTLRITDTGPGDTGTVDSWTLNYCGQPSLSSPEQQLLNGVSISPNPAIEHINVIFPKAFTDPVQLQVYDLQGRLVLTKSTTNNITLSTTNLKSGVYLINLSTNQFETSRRFIVE